ncbi:ion-transporting P-type ATPase [Paratrimastix pyriformis]|uniref:Calcium-transporting ATPase n=1 Tax=Paratrimastix pyriformis TaxID=342808 RepID=A0ABQ8UKB8_9EUKA|nr:ion-transporting P-type ATPase [Paratrimastix pyriformis]
MRTQGPLPPSLSPGDSGPPVVPTPRSHDAVITPSPSETPARQEDVSKIPLAFSLHPHGRWGMSSDDLIQLCASRSLDALELFGGSAAIAQHLHTDLQSGLSEKELERRHERIEAFGVNHIPGAPPKNFFVILWGALTDVTIIILICAAVLSLVLGIVFPDPTETVPGYVDGVAILVAVAIVGLVTASNDWSKDRQFRKLNERKTDIPIKVTRDGQHTQQISIFDLVVGDVVELTSGDTVPADGLFLDGYNLEIDESSMTGEAATIKKSNKKPFLLSGTFVTEGLGRMLVLCVGVNTEWGQTLSRLADDDEDETPLQEALDDMSKTIGKIGLVAAVLTFIALCLQNFLPYAFDPSLWNTGFYGKLVSYLIMAITIVVVAVPEGLPLAVTISLAYSMRRMMQDQNLVRNLSACETMGSATNICSDKTGTLTENRMTVTQAWIATKAFSKVWDSCFPMFSACCSPGVCSARLYGHRRGTSQAHSPLTARPPATPRARGPVFTFFASLLGSNKVTSMRPIEIEREEEAPAQVLKRDSLAPELTHLLVEGICANSTATLTNQKGKLAFIGNKTEGSLLVLVQKLGFDYKDVRAECEPRCVSVFTFNSERKRMTTVLRQPDSRGFRVYCKGASDWLLPDCSSFLDEGGRPCSCAEYPEFREQANEVIEAMASKGLRTLLLAYRDLVAFDPQTQAHEVEQDLTAIGIVGIKDPPRPEAREAVLRCQSAGICVRMITGDNLITARAIASELRILTDGVAMTASDFHTLSPEEQQEVLPRLQVMARSSPTNKFDLVQRLKALDEVVAVTGDGTNDAAALKEADVGLSMGISGTEVAKEASDIVILDDNFASVVKSVMWGRSVYDNIRKFLQFQLTVNVVALVLSFVGAVSGQGTPITAVQMLWVNLIMDTFAALALATEPPTQSMMERPPAGRNEYLISPLMLRNIVGQAIYQLAVVFVFLYAGKAIFGFVESSPTSLAHTHTLVFNAFVLCQLFNELCSRKVNGEMNLFSGILNNWIFGAVLLFTLVVQIVIVELGSSFMQTSGLSVAEWFACFLVGFFTIPLAFLLMTLRVPSRLVRKVTPKLIAERRALQQRKAKKREKQKEARQKAAKERAVIMAQMLGSKLPIASSEPSEALTVLPSPDSTRVPSLLGEDRRLPERRVHAPSMQHIASARSRAEPVLTVPPACRYSLARAHSTVSHSSLATSLAAPNASLHSEILTGSLLPPLGSGSAYARNFAGAKNSETGVRHEI